MVIATDHGIYESDFHFATEQPMPVADRRGQGSDMEGKYSPVPAAPLASPDGDGWTDLYNPQFYSSDDILKILPKDKEMFYDKKNDFFWIRKIKPPEPDLKDLTS